MFDRFGTATNHVYYSSFIYTTRAQFIIQITGKVGISSARDINFYKTSKIESNSPAMIRPAIISHCVARSVPTK